MLKIQKKLSLVNRTIASNRNKKYIVIHYVGAVSTAKNNVDYFNNTINRLNRSNSFNKYHNFKNRGVHILEKIHNVDVLLFVFLRVCNSFRKAHTLKKHCRFWLWDLRFPTIRHHNTIKKYCIIFMEISQDISVDYENKL